MDVFSRALIVAASAHGDQKQKYTGLPYLVHPIAVAAKVREALTADGERLMTVERAAAAAVLHDVLEDTPVSFEFLLREFGHMVAQLVWELTDVSKPSDGNRAVRKEIDRKHLSHASYPGKTIKLADLIDNTASIVAGDPGFAKVYLKEKALLLDVLSDGHPGLLAEAKRTLTYALAAID